MFLNRTQFILGIFNSQDCLAQRNFCFVYFSEQLLVKDISNSSSLKIKVSVIVINLLLRCANQTPCKFD